MGACYPASVTFATLAVCIEPAALVHVLLTADGAMHARSVGMEPEFRSLFAAQLRDIANQLCPSTQQRAA